MPKPPAAMGAGIRTEFCNSILPSNSAPTQSLLTALPKHLDAYLDGPFGCQKSLELDRWLWYTQQEFEGVRS